MCFVCTLIWYEFIRYFVYLRRYICSGVLENAVFVDESRSVRMKMFGTFVILFSFEDTNNRTVVRIKLV